MINVAIVDDEEEHCALIEKYLHRYAQESENIETTEFMITSFSDGNEFLKRTDYFDVVFLDIEMPQTDGMTAAKTLRERNQDSVIVFITNMAQYALKGYEVDAVDFIVKPVTYYDFTLKLKKVLRYLARNANKSVVIKAVGGQVLRINCTDIFYIEVIQHYLKFHTVNGDVEARGTITDMENRLAPYSFARCAKSYLVNLKRVETVHGNEIVVAGQTLFISRTRREEFLSKFYKYLGGLR